MFGVVAACVVLLFVSAALFAMNYPRQMKTAFVDSSTESLMDKLSAVSDYTNQNVSAGNAEICTLTDMIGPMIGSKGSTVDEIYSTMKAVQKNAGFKNIAICDLSSDRLIASLSDGSERQLSSWVLEGDLKAGKVLVDMEASPLNTSLGGEDMVVYRTVFKGADGKSYLLVAERPQETLSGLLSVDSEHEGLTMLVRSSGNVMYSEGSINGKNQSSYNLFSSLLANGVSQETIDEARKNMESGKAGVIQLAINGVDSRYVYRPIEGTDWICVRAYSDEELAGENLTLVNSKTLQLVGIVALLIIAALAMSAAVVFSRIKAEGQRHVAERERLFEEMSAHIPSAFAILREDEYEPRFLSHNFKEVVPYDIEFSMEGLGAWMDFDDSVNPAELYSAQGRLESLIKKDDRYYTVGIYSMGVIEGELHHTVVFNDVTESQESRMLLEDSMARASEASKSKTSFLSKMSHEIRTPLNAVLGFSRLALDRWDSLPPESLRGYIEKVQASGDYLLELVSDILDVSRIEEGRMEIALAPMNLGELVDGVRDAFAGQMEGKSLTYTVNKNFDDVTLNMDAFHMRQVLNNLVSNSCKYTEEGGSVDLTVSVTDLPDNRASVRFAVSDTGVGMTPEFLERIFDPFTQEQSDIKDQLRGSGLGMSICKTLVELQGGIINVTSELGKGSEFVVQVSFDKVGDAAAASTDAGAIDAAALAGMTVLIADDRELNRVILEDFLDEYEVDFLEAEDGQQAIDSFSQSKPGEITAIFMDGRMPNVDGYEATRAIRALDRPDAKTVGIIGMTADAFADDVNRALMSGMDYHLAKPIDFDRLLAVMYEIKTNADKEA